MSNPERTVATLSFAPAEFAIMQANVEDLKQLPESYAETLRKSEAAIQSIQRHWRGMSEEDIRKDAKQREAERSSIIHYNGTVVESPGARRIRAHLVSEHPIIAAAAEVIKFGPPVVRVLDGSEEYYRLLWGFDDKAMERLKEGMPGVYEPSYDRDVAEVDDLSGGTGLLMRGINVRTGRAALGAYELPPITEGGPRFDIGFTMDPSLKKQEVEVIILEREGSFTSGMGSLLLEQLAHLREVS